MGRLFGYLITIAMLSVPWGTTYWLFSHGKWISALLVFWFSILLSISLIDANMDERKLDKKYNLTEDDYEVVMTQLDRVEKLNEKYYIVHTKWVDPEGGAEYFFESDYIDFNPKLLLQNRKIPVKISIDDYTIYSVDLRCSSKKSRRDKHRKNQGRGES